MRGVKGQSPLAAPDSRLIITQRVGASGWTTDEEARFHRAINDGRYQRWLALPAADERTLGEFAASDRDAEWIDAKAAGKSIHAARWA